MKLGSVTKLDKRNKTTSKKIDVDVMSENCDVIVIFRIFGQFGAVRRLDSGQFPPTSKRTPKKPTQIRVKTSKSKSVIAEHKSEKKNI